MDKAMLFFVVALVVVLSGLAAIYFFPLGTRESKAARKYQRTSKEPSGALGSLRIDGLRHRS